MSRILVIAGDVVPFPGYPATGAGLRAWSLGKGLESAGHDVFYSIPLIHLKPDSPGPEKELAWHPEDRLKPVRKVKPEIVLVCHWPAMPDKRLELPTILDLHGPHLMERCYWQRQEARDGIQEKVDAFRKADFFCCAGQRQRYYFMNWLMLAGFELQSDLISVVPISLEPELPEKKSNGSSGAPHIVYGGMFLPWQDPVDALDALMHAMDIMQCGRLSVFGGEHPLVKDSSGRFARLMERLQNNPRVNVHNQVSHEQLLNVYQQADLAFDFMKPNFERELAFTTRTVEYMWCGLPVMYNDYSELTDYIRHYDAGWCIATEESSVKLIDNFVAILSNPGSWREKSRNAQKMITEQFTWDRTITPLDRFCREPHRTLPDSPLLLKPAQPSAQSEDVRHSLLKRIKHRFT